MDVSEWFTSLKATLYERTTSPLFSAFALSWAAINYKFFLIAFSGDEISAKLAVMQAEVFPPGGERFLHLLAYPTLATGFFLFIYPYLAKPTYRWWLARQSETRRDQIHRRSIAQAHG